MLPIDHEDLQAHYPRLGYTIADDRPPGLAGLLYNKLPGSESPSLLTCASSCVSWQRYVFGVWGGLLNKLSLVGPRLIK